MSPTIGGYAIEKEIGRGAMGRVFRAKHIASGVVRALKVLDSNADPEVVARFRREADALARLGGEAVVAVHESGVAAGRLYFAMDLMPGGSLEERLGERGKIPWEEAATLVALLARSLARCHALGIIHRDVKPANVLFDADDRPRLVDFGLARDLEASSALTETGTEVGSPGYMAPECCRGERAGPAADVFALGVVLHELITGSRPFAGSTPLAIVRAILRGERRPASESAECPAALETAIARAVAAKAEERFASADELAAALEAVAPGAEGRARGLVAALLGVGLALAVAGAVVAAVVPRLRRGAEKVALEPPAPVETARTVPARASSSADGAEIRRLIGKRDVAKARERLGAVTLDGAEMAAVVSAALSESEALAKQAPDDREAQKAASREFQSAVALYELARDLDPDARPPEVLVGKARWVHFQRWSRTELRYGMGMEGLEVLEIILRSAVRRDDDLEYGRALANAALAMYEERTLRADLALRFIDAARAALPGRGMLRFYRWKIERDPATVAAAFEEAWTDQDFEPNRLCWFTIVAALTLLDAKDAATASRFLERAASSELFRNERKARTQELMVRLAALRALARLRSGDLPGARQVVRDESAATRSPYWERLAGIAEASELDAALERRGRSSEALRATDR